MTPQPDFLSKLAALPLRRLRELARVLGIPRYSAQAREGLLQAIASKSPATDSPAEPVSASLPLDVVQDSSAPPAAAPALAPVTYLDVHPQDAQWAYCRWEISPTDRDLAQASGGGSLCLRLADKIGRAHV